MPYKSHAEVGWMHANKPEIAARWDKKYGVPKGLPEHVKKPTGYKRASKGGR